MKHHVPIIEVTNLSKSYRSKSGVVHALRNLSFRINSGKSLALVGESGCGKTTATNCITRLVEPDTGEICLAGENFRTAKGSGERRMRGSFGMVFQNPLAALNPRFEIWRSIAEPLRIHAEDLSETARRAQAEAMLTRVGLGARHASAYPSQLSGGQLQRVVLARALILNPQLVFLDEPTSALDVSVQAQVLNLLQDIREATGLSYLFITHNLALVEIIADEVIVMFAGRMVEKGRVSEVFSSPRHPYTMELLRAVPDLSLQHRAAFHALRPVSNQAAAEGGCPYRLRCTRQQPICASSEPHLEDGQHQVACFFPL